MDCILLTKAGVERDGRTGRKRGLGCAGVAVLAFLALAAPAIAQPPPHVRGENGIQRLIDDAARRSPAIREWIDRLQGLDVTVDVRARPFAQLKIDGASRCSRPPAATAISSSSWRAGARS